MIENIITIVATVFVIWLLLRKCNNEDKPLDRIRTQFDGSPDTDIW